MLTKYSHPAIEMLESRIAPASVIDVIVQGGTLTLKTSLTDDGSESLEIKNGTTANAYVLDPSLGTKLRVNGIELAVGESYLVKNITGLVSISLGANNDYLSAPDTKFPAGLKIDTGNGNNSVNLSGSTAAFLAIKGGANDDAVSLSGANIAGSVTLDLGAGRNDAALGKGTLIAGDLTIKGGVGVDEVLSFGPSSEPLRIAGKFTVDLGEGENLFQLGGGVVVGRDLSIKSGRGPDRVEFTGSGNQVIGGNLTVNTGAGADKTDLDGGGTLQVGKNLSVTSGGADGAAVLQQIRAQGGLSVGGNLTLKSGPAGTVTQKLVSYDGDIAVAGSITLGAGLGKAVQNIEAEYCLTIGKGLSLAAAGGGLQSVFGNTQSSVGGSRITGPVTITGGTDIHLAVNGDLHGPVKIAVGKTDSSGQVLIGNPDPASPLSIHGPVTVALNSQAGGQAHAVSFVNTTLKNSVTLSGNAGADQFYLDDVVTYGALNINAGAGDDDLIVEKGVTAPNVSNFLGTVTFLGGAGEDGVEWGRAQTLYAARLVTIDGGAGTDTYIQGTGAVFDVPVKTLNF